MRIWYLYWSGRELGASVNPDFAQEDLAARGWLREEKEQESSQIKKTPEIEETRKIPRGKSLENLNWPD